MKEQKVNVKKDTWVKEQYTEWCIKNEMNCIAWMEVGIWKLKGLKRGKDKVSCLLCSGKEDANTCC
jgi:hypothetical protein